jgi:hypothetical protein
VSRKLVVEQADGSTRVLEQVAAANEAELQERLKHHPGLLPLDDLGLVEPAVVVGREASLASGRADLVLLGNGGDLLLVEFKTGPQNPDFRECLAQLLDYGSDLWEMSLEEFETRVAQRYFTGPHCPPGTIAAGTSLDEVVTATWGAAPADAVGWRERLQAQLRDGSFHYVVVAQRFTPSMLHTLQYLNATMKAARFSAVELVRFSGIGAPDVLAFEARLVEGTETSRTVSGTTKNALAGVAAILESVTDDEYRHHLTDFFDALETMPGLAVFWGTTGCSLRVSVPGRSPLSVGWVFPQGPPRWMGLTDVTLGWYEDANGLYITASGHDGLDLYLDRLTAVPGATAPKSGSIKGRTFAPETFVANADALQDAVRDVVAALVEG